MDLSLFGFGFLVDLNRSATEKVWFTWLELTPWMAKVPEEPRLLLACCCLNEEEEEDDDVVVVVAMVAVVGVTCAFWGIQVGSFLAGCDGAVAEDVDEVEDIEAGTAEGGA